MGKNRLSRENISSLFTIQNEFPKYFRYPGRKVSRRLSKKNIDLIRDYYLQYSLDQEIIDYHQKKTNKKKILSNTQFSKVNVEIGFGDGEFLLKNAISKPSELFVGAEFYINGIVKVLKQIRNLKIDNLKITNLNSLYLLQSMPKKSIDKMYIINPDPWKKKKHQKRRLISLENLELFNQVIKTKKSIYITTDSLEYFKSIAILYNNTKLLGNLDAGKLLKSNPLYGVSKYQRKAIEKGGNIYLIRI